MRLKENKKNFVEISFRGFAQKTRETLTSYYNSLKKKFGILPNFSTRPIHLKRAFTFNVLHSLRRNEYITLRSCVCPFKAILCDGIVFNSK